jgi:hypothetical protein
MGIIDTLKMGKSQIEMVKMQTENEQRNLAEVVCGELNMDGFECKIKPDGHQTIMAGVIPIKIEKLLIVPTKPFDMEKQERFDAEKERITNYWAKERQMQYKQEIKELKKKKDEEKR